MSTFAIPKGIIDYSLGPHLAGASVAALFTGVLLHQFTKYLTYSTDEPLYRRIYVYIAVFVTVGTSGLEFATSWERIILGAEFFGYPDLPMTGSGSMITAFLAIYVQSFYLHRLFLLSKRNWYLVTFLGTILVTAFALSLAAVGRRLVPRPTDNATSLLLYNVHLAFILTGDILLSSTTVGYLVYYRKKVLPSSAGLFMSLILITFQSAAPATLWIIVEFAFSIAYPNPPSVPFARVSAAIGMNLVLAKLWAISLLGTLNSRPKEKPHNPTTVSNGDNINSQVYVSRGGMRNLQRESKIRIQTETTSLVVRDSASDSTQARPQYKSGMSGGSGQAKGWTDDGETA
ncbi:hypothetical protein MIND_01407700 [Mycena indigotica]|uniref:Uncharacterized protein n=1 Tax=Mycena indigotica TaxID=2126181 RepID=A0A8H6RYI2_9AGAR|nr:uncharacterized protein MIND_01407700 [Mycena indigotica]KAF7288915.1 hypothetical protein MIND_01407700 [Mycena indigotica]